MKRLLFILATVSLLFACGGSKNKQETPPVEESTTVEDVVKEKADDVADFTAEQWAELKKEYNDLVEKAKKEAEKFTEEEQSRLDELKKLIESTKEKASDTINDAAESIKDALN